MNPENEKKLSELLDFLLNNGNLVVDQLPNFAREMLAYGYDCALWGLCAGIVLFFVSFMTGLISYNHKNSDVRFFSFIIFALSGLIGFIATTSSSTELWTITYYPNIYLFETLRHLCN